MPILVGVAAIASALAAVSLIDLDHQVLADIIDQPGSSTVDQVTHSAPLDLPPRDAGPAGRDEPPVVSGSAGLPVRPDTTAVATVSQQMILPLLDVAPPADRTDDGEAEVAPADGSTQRGDNDLPPSLLEPLAPTTETDLEIASPGDAVDALAAAAEVGAVTAGPTASRWIEHQVAKGESLARIFAAHGMSPAVLHRIVNSGDTGRSLANIRPGQRLRFEVDDDGELQRMELHRSRIDLIRVALADDAVAVEQISKEVDKRVASAAGVIESSLFVDGQRAGLSDAKIMELAEIFGWDIDFALELRAGDEFRVLYEEHLLNDEKLRDGPILAAEFTNRGQVYRAVRYETADGESGYYDDDGNSKRRAFIRTPIRFARISSRFDPKRWHPVLKRWRSHKGVDYAAPTGTPIKASGDGKVVFRGTKGGYGRTVILQHAGKYTTLYAHMSGYSKRARVGERVKQGQVIGYVGQSGLASGPHLHYEFRVDGVHKDPLRVKLPKALALPEAELAAFKAAARPLLARLDEIPQQTMVASLDSAPAN